MTTLNSVLPQNFAEALNKNDISLVRAMLIAELNDSNVNIDDVLNITAHIENSTMTLFDSYSVSPFFQAIDENTANWTKDYFAMQLVYLNKNFSRERFLHLVNVNQALFAKAEQKQSEKQLHFEPEIVVEQQIEEPKVHQVEELFVHHSEEPTESRVEEVVELTTYSSTTSSKTQYHTEYEPKSNSQTDEEDTSRTSYRDEPDQSHSVWKTALKIGGAVAAIVIGLIAIFK